MSNQRSMVPTVEPLLDKKGICFTLTVSKVSGQNPPNFLFSRPFFERENKKTLFSRLFGGEKMKILFIFTTIFGGENYKNFIFTICLGEKIKI